MYKEVSASAGEHVHHLLTEKEAASYIRVSYESLKTARRRGSIPGWLEAPPFIRLGNLVRYDRAALDAYLRQHTVGGVQ